MVAKGLLKAQLQATRYASLGYQDRVLLEYLQVRRLIQRVFLLSGHSTLRIVLLIILFNRFKYALRGSCVSHRLLDQVLELVSFPARHSLRLDPEDEGGAHAFFRFHLDIAT